MRVVYDVLRFIEWIMGDDEDEHLSLRREYIQRAASEYASEKL